MTTKLLYVGMHWDYGDPARGESFEHWNFHESLKSFASKHDWQFLHYDFMHRGLELGQDAMTQELYDLCLRERPDVLFAVMFDFHRDPRLDVFKRISDLGCVTVHWFCDDHWRFEKYSQYVAPYFDLVTTTANSALPKYRQIGLASKVIKSQWACNHELYRPQDIPADIDVSFVGMNHGNRQEVLASLGEQGLPIEIYGYGWPDRPRVSFPEMTALFSRSKINLNLSNSSVMTGQQIKGRNFEVPACNAFLLTAQADNLEEYFVPDKEVVVYQDEGDLLEKARFFLAHDDLRQDIAKAGYRRVLAEHTWHHRFTAIFQVAGLLPLRGTSAYDPISSVPFSRPAIPGEHGVVRAILEGIKEADPMRGEALQLRRHASDLADANCVRVSIVIPCYKQAHFLREAVDSVVGQSFPDWECLIVNDGSPDNTSEVVRQLIAEYPDKRIKLLEKSNGGLASARNYGIKASRGNYILPLDADDRLHECFLEKTVQVLDESPSVSIVYTDLQQFGASHHVIRPIEFTPSVLPYQNHLNYCSLYRREVWDVVGGYNPNMKRGYEDWDFWVGCVEKGLVARRIPEALFHYRIKEQSMYTESLKFDQELRAQIILNHPSLYKPAEIQQAAMLLGHNDSHGQSEWPLVSVIVPTYNRPEMLAKALESICGQTYSNIEIIVINDAGSCVEHVIEASAARDRTTYIRLATNQDRAAARNAGIKLASGKYIAYLDDDDLYYPDHLSTLVAELESSAFKVAYTDAHRIHHKAVGTDYVEAGRDLPYSYDFDCDRMLYENYIPILCIMHERSCLEDTGLFDESLPVLEDWDLWIRLSRKYDFLHVKKVTCAFSWRQDGSSTTSSRIPEFWKMQEHIYEKYRAFALGKPGVQKRQAQNREWIAEQRKNLHSPPPVTSLTSIVILTLNKLEVTRLCLDSVFRHSRGFEVIVVDNGSTDGTVAYLQALAAVHPNLKLVLNRINRGFAAGCNQGIAVAGGDYVLLLNNDTVVSDGWLDGLLAVAAQNGVGLVGPRTNSIIGPQIVENTGYDARTLEGFDSYAQTWRETHRGQAWDTSRVIGFCMLIARDVIERIGGLDTNFGTGNFEDDDYCLRAMLAGFKIRIANEVFIHHFGSVTFRDQQINYSDLMAKNWGLFKSKWGIPATRRPEEGYQAVELLKVQFDSALHAVPIFASQGEMAELPDRRAYNVLLCEPDTARCSKAIRAYLEAFPEGTDVALHVLAPDRVEEVHGLILEVLEDLGCDPERIPDISLLNAPSDALDLPAYLRSAQLVIGSQMVVEGARDMGIPAFKDPEPEGLRVALESFAQLNWRELSVPIVDAKPHRWLVATATNWEEPLADFLRSIRPDQPVSLLLQVPPNQSESTFEAVSDWLGGEGYDLDAIPDISILDSRECSTVALFKSATAVISSGDPLTRSIGEALGIRCVEKVAELLPELTGG